MKNFIIFTFIIILLGLPVLALHGGDSQTLLSIDKCVDVIVSVNASQTIDAGEYNLTGCNESNKTNLWVCGCNEHFDLILNTLPNTINSYDFIINYTTYKKTSSGGGGGNYHPPSNGGGGSSNLNVTEVYHNPALDYTLDYYPNRTRPVVEDNNNNSEFNETVVEEPEVVEEDVEINQTANISVDVGTDKIEDNGFPWWGWLLLFLTLFFLILLVVFLVGVALKKREDEQEKLM